MKKLFKKSIACLIAVLMVVSTMPFTAITAQAADTSALLSAMQSFEAKMDGSVYTNMDTAYSAYVAASKAYDAAYYGGDASVDVTTPATNLNKAVSQMTKTNLTVYTGTAKARFSKDTSDISQSKNLLYSKQGVTYGLDNCTALFANDMILHNTGVSWSKISSCVYHADSVILYDGTSASIPVICYVDNFIDGSSGKAKVDKYSVYLTNSSYYGLQNSAWKGGSNSGQNFQTIYNGSDTNISSDSSSTTYQGYESGAITSFSDQHQYEYYANVLTTNSNLANIFTTTNPYSATLPAVTWNMHVVGQAKTTTGRYGSTDHTLTANSSAKIYAINYLPLKNAITADANSTARQNVASYKEGGMSTYLAGCLLAAGLNPNSYSYSTDLAGQVSQCASDISTAVTKFTTAPTADNTSNYPALRSAFDYSGELTGFNNATYSVRDAYNGGVNNGFTQASYDNFKAKYEAAQNVMKAVATSGYVNDGFAGDAATALLTAFNALQHEHSFTGAYVNNNDGTHKQKCKYFDICGGYSESVAHSFTNYVSNNDATCTADGTKTATCDSGCGATDTIADVDSKLGHSFTNYVSNNDATCTADGTKTAKCDRCDVTDTITDVGSKLDHSFTTYTQTLAPTCTTVGKEEAVCDNGCGTKDVRDVAINENAHNYGAWIDDKNGKSHTRTCLNNSEHTQTEAHNIVNGACTECNYVTIDTTAYDNAVAEYNSIIGADDYAAKYTEASRTAYQEAVEAAKRDSFATKEEVDAATSAILSAKTKLVYAKADVKVYIAREGVDPVLVDTISKNYGETADINVVDKLSAGEYIAKWVIETQEKKVNTKLATTDTIVSMVVTEPADVYVHVASEVATESEQYSKVSFISKNGAVSFVKYVKAGETLNTIDVPGVEIPFYEFKNWNKASVTADGSDIEVKAVYEFIGTEENKCRVHYDGFDGGVKEYTYDSFVYLFGAEDKTLALSTDGTVENIITYLNENAFYAPHTADIYVITVARQPASIGITGSYASSTDTKKTAAFNCKFFLPAGCTVVEYGLTATSSTGKSMKIKAEAASARGEYCVKVSMAKTSPVTSVEGVAYLTYKDAENYLHTIYSTPVTQNL